MMQTLLRHGFALLSLSLLVGGGPASAQEHRLWVGLDLDLDDTTGCDLEGTDSAGAQTATGFEWRVEITIDPSAAVTAVSALAASSCDSAVTRSETMWGIAKALDATLGAVGSNQGEGASDAVELEIETDDLALGTQVRIALHSESAGGHRDLLFTQDGTSTGADILFPSAASLPALSASSLGLLALLFAASVLLLVRRSPGAGAVWLAVLALGVPRAVDGLAGEWTGVAALANDVAEDSETNDPSADILGFFVDWNGSNLALRVDVSDIDAEVCAHSATPCYYVSASNGSNTANDGLSDSSPWETLTYAIPLLPIGARLIVEEGTYQPDARLSVGSNGVHILGQGNVTLENPLAEFLSSGGWDDSDGDGIYQSTTAYPTTVADEDVFRAWGRFPIGSEEYMLISYECYGALANASSLYPSTVSTCTAPYIGPGIFWDHSGTGHIYLRMDTTPEPLNTLMAENGWTLPADPNDIEMQITLGGPWLQLDASNVRVHNLTLELGSMRMGGGTSGNEINGVTLNGPAIEEPLEFYSGAIEHVLDGIIIDQHLPPWVTWQDSKNLFTNSLQRSAISLNATSETHPEVIRDIILRNSTIRNVHDGFELINDAHHHLYIVDNVFENVQDDGIQLGTTTYEIEIARNTFDLVGTGVSRHGTGANDYPGRKYIHHNTIDASTAKYFCREKADGEYGSTCTGDGKLTLRGFHLHNGDGWGLDGDPRYYYNNTVLVRGSMIGIGLQGQEYQTHCDGGGFPGDLGSGYACDLETENWCNNLCVAGDNLGTICGSNGECNSPADGECSASFCVNEYGLALGLTCSIDDDCNSPGDGLCSSGSTCQNYELPYEQPSLVFNNVFIQLDETENLLVETPKWSLIAPPVLITGGNYYIRTPATHACSGGGFPGEIAGDFVCDIAATDPCNGLCVEGSDVMLGQGCTDHDDCDLSDACLTGGSCAGVCSSGASCAAYTPEGPFWMSGKTCELDDFQDYACNTPNAWSPQLSPEWTGSASGVLFSWGLEESGVWDDTIADPATYVPTCGTESPAAPIDLRNIDGAYQVTDNGVVAWTLTLEQPLPGLEDGGLYRGATPCVSGSL